MRITKHMERTYGSKHDGALSTTEIAARFRADVKTATKAGDLPKGMKLSVKTSYYSMGSSINVRIKSLPARIDLTEAKHLESKLEMMLEAYNHDGSDSQCDHFDVKFYGHIDIDWKLARELRARDEASIEAMSSVGSEKCCAVEAFVFGVSAVFA
jgi:hypothetical protein